MSKAAELAKIGEVATNSQIGGRRNIIINGAMQINQRGSVTFDHAATGTANIYGLDRFEFQSTGLDQLEGTVAQAADAPVGFTNSLKWTTTEPESAIAAAETFDCCQKIEAQDLQQLAFGTSSAKKLTLRFYVKSSVTGTYGINVFKADSTARQLTSTYTISSANTWEEKTILIPADTDSSGTIANDNGEGLRITWHLGVGSDFTSADTALTWTDYANAGWAFGHAQNNVALTDNATWQLTGVQLEVGSVATPFEHRSFGEELALCQRYFTKEAAASGANYKSYAMGQAATTTVARCSVFLPTSMRSTPTLVLSGDVNTFAGNSAGGSDACTAIALSGDGDAGTDNVSVSLNVTVGSGYVAGDAVELLSNDNVNTSFALDAEI